jgi:hypothetical protein
MTPPTVHPAPAVLDRYAAGLDLPADALWAVETHLADCARCRGRLAADTAEVAALVDQVWARVAPVVAAEPPVRRRRWPLLARWAAPTALPWLAMTVLVPLAAMLMDLTAGGSGPDRPSLLLLVAPVVPVLGVAASWSGRLDPAHALVGSAARAGLGLVLRRTLAVLLLVLPPLAVAGAVVGATPAVWLLPGLAFVAGTLALGARIGIGRAAAVLTTGWVAAVVTPSLLWSRTPVVLDPAGTPVWAVCAVLAAGAVVWWRDTFRRAGGLR